MSMQGGKSESAPLTVEPTSPAETYQMHFKTGDIVSLTTCAMRLPDASSKQIATLIPQTVQYSFETDICRVREQRGK